MNLKILSIKIVLFFFLASVSESRASIKNNVLVNVGDQIITSFELKNKIKTLLFLSDQKLSQKNINENKNLAIKSLISFKLKKLEITKYNMSTSEDAVKGHLDKISSKFNISSDQLKDLFYQNQINYEIFLEEIEVEFSWQKLIFQLYSNKISLDENVINKEFENTLQNQEKGVEYRLAEIELLVDDIKSYEQKIKEINQQIKNIGFENTAIKFSQSTSAINGGDLGWLNVKALSNEIASLIKKMNIGEVSKPIIKANSATLIKLLDKKEIEMSNVDVNKIKKRILNQKKNDLLSLYSNNHLSKLKNNTFIKFK